MTVSNDPLRGRTRPFGELGWWDRLRYGPEFLGYPPAAFVGVLALVVVTTLVEGVGLALVYPIIELMQSGQTPAAIAERSEVFAAIASVFARLGVPLSLGSLMLAAGAVVFVRQILNYATASIRAFLNYRAVERIATRVFTLFTEADVALIERFRSGSFINVIFSEAKRAGMLALAVQNLIGGLLRVSIYGAVLTVLSWQATVIGVALILLATLFFTRRAARASAGTGQRIARGNDSITRYAAERFGMLRLIKVMGQAHHEAGDFATRNASLRRLNVQIGRQAARLTALIEGGTVIGALALVYVALNVLEMPLAILAVFLAAVLRLMPVGQEIASSVQNIAAYMGSFAFIDRLSLDAAAARETDGGTKAFPPLREGIRFDKIDFDYRGRGEETAAVPALRGVSFSIPAGKTTAILGPSGAGKSTLMDLLPRLRNPTGGAILFDDVDARDIRLADLRRHIAMVSQDSLVLDGSIAENLAYTDAEVSREEIVAAAKAARAHEFIEKLPDGYETMVGERGVLLSGGQKQRLALARALARKAPILLLDEPTSALDAETELAVQETLTDLQAAGEVTVVIIAHRLSTIRHADHIVVMEAGGVLGTGTHDELMASAPWYARVVELQLGPEAAITKDA